MNKIKSGIKMNFDWVGQVKEYRKRYPRYEKYAIILNAIFKKATRKFAPLAIVESRAKTISSFAEKILRKQNQYKDPVRNLTDLCGARIITTSKEEVKLLCQFIENHFIIDWENTVDVHQRHKPSEFGYLSVHYIVQFRPDVFPTKEIDIHIPKDLYPTTKDPMKSEIQVRTLLEHAWATFTHDRSYKCGFTLPDKLQRELNGLAAILEDVDNSFDRILVRLNDYLTSYGASMAKEKIKEEIRKKELVLKQDPSVFQTAHQIGKLAILQGDWNKAVKVLSPHADTGYLPLLRDLGVALCKLHAKNPKHPEYKKGQRYLECACIDQDVDALASLAGTWKKIDDKKARLLYEQALEIDSSNPYPLGNYLEYEINRIGDTSFLPLLKPVITAGIKRCRDYADVEINLPWAFYDMGKFYLLLGKPYESIAAYAKAIQLSTEDWMIKTSLASLEKLKVVQEKITGYDWACRLLMLGRVARFSGKDAIKDLKAMATPKVKPINHPVVIVVGGCDANIEKQMRGYRRLLIKAFKGFKGTVVAGGTTAGISGLVGEISKKYRNNVKTVSYVPKSIPAGVIIDKRYNEIRRTQGEDFTVLEPLQNWIDIITSGIELSQVKVFGINGGAISAAEYRIALALGARVAVLEESGREAAKLVKDTDWSPSMLLTHLPLDPATINAFISYSSYKMEPPNIREVIGKAFHESYRETKASSKQIQEPSMAEWNELLENLKESNRQQADHIEGKLRMIGCSVQKAKDRKVKLIKFPEKEIELMAEAEHARWNVERLFDGWKWGKERDVLKKISPYLIPWAELPEKIKEFDRNAVRNIPNLLAKVGLEVHRE
jgi:ppGpp synthetase/RelA/SpoT-type nucleotidyltranferase